MLGLAPESPQALDFDVAVMTRATLEEFKRAEERAHMGPPGTLHLDAERIGAAEAEDMTFGVVA